MYFLNFKFGWCAHDTACLLFCTFIASVHVPVPRLASVTSYFNKKISWKLINNLCFFQLKFHLSFSIQNAYASSLRWSHWYPTCLVIFSLYLFCLTIYELQFLFLLSTLIVKCLSIFRTRIRIFLLTRISNRPELVNWYN